jgi:hypothetical protein
MEYVGELGDGISCDISIGLNIETVHIEDAHLAQLSMLLVGVPEQNGKFDKVSIFFCMFSALAEVIWP